MSKHSRQDHFSPIITASGQCVDCDVEFPITMYPSDSSASAFTRDHPQNGCVSAAAIPVLI